MRRAALPRSILLGAVLLGSILLATRPLAAQGETPWRFGVLFWHDSPNDVEALRGIRAALDVRGRDYHLQVERAEQDAERGAAALRAFDDGGVDLVFAMGTQAALVARAHPPRAPVVFTAVTNPVESGVVDDWNGSGTRIAGNSNWIAPDTLLRVFRLAVPGLHRLGVLRSRASGVVSAAEVVGVQRMIAAEPAPRLALVEEVIDSPDELDAATARLLEQRIDALWIPIDFTVYEHLDAVTARTAPARVPLVSSSLRAVSTDAVAGVLVDYELLGERAVVLALDILEHGRDPATIPVDTMRGFQVVVNLGAARRSGYEAPLALIVVADQILEPEVGDGH
ncbi:MAG: ABC transporter substrate-binding protein [Planctomycetes bacterium]|nr:ABC transporter substrate-binding protein [Planctomycetota bacterium]